jgi:hypothetical protein
MKLTIELQIPYSFVPGQEITMQIDTEKYQVHHINTQMNQPFDKSETCISFQGFMQEIIKEKIINEKQRTIDKILRWFPLVGEYLRVESECLMHGFSEEQTDKLVHGQALKFRGYLQADKRSPRVWAESVTAQIIRMTKDKLQLTVEQSPIIQWIQQRLQVERQERQEQKTTHKQGFHM